MLVLAIAKEIATRIYSTPPLAPLNVPLVGPNCQRLLLRERDFGSRAAIDLPLHRLTSAGTIRRIARGLYYYLETHRLLGAVAPSIEAVANALQRTA